MTTRFADNERTARIRRAGRVPLGGGASASDRPVLPTGRGRVLGPQELDQAMMAARHERSKAAWNLASLVKNGIVGLYCRLVRRQRLLRTLDALRRVPPHLRADIGVRSGDLRRIKDVERIIQYVPKGGSPCG